MIALCMSMNVSSNSVVGDELLSPLAVSSTTHPHSTGTVEEQQLIALVQRVTQASVTIDGSVVGEISAGMCVLLGVKQADNAQTMQKLVDKLLGYRIFSDADGRMNLDIRQSGGEILLVPQFTLAADTSQGRRPGFSTAAKPDLANALFDAFCQQIQQQHQKPQTGQFGADMQVALINDGPVTFWLET
jgi:D-tyrosyl-tRNA(Tyr) deacylase